MKKYWIIRWNETVRGQKRSSRMFQTFLDKSEFLFETYGYRSGIDVRRFKEVKRGDQIFCFQAACYQSCNGAYVALGEVKAVEPKAPGGRSLVLLAKRLSSPRVEKKFWGKHTIYKLNPKKAEALFARCGLERGG
jgi:hypothetical protein